MRTLLTLTAILGLVGCVGGIDGPPVGDDGSGSGSNPDPVAKLGKKMFDETVYPIIGGATGKCIGCHKNGATAGGAPASAGFVGVDVATGYDVMVMFPSVHGQFASSAKLLTYITVQGHQSISYTSADRTNIEAWLAKELQERAGGGGTVENPAEKLLAKFSGCMTQTNFDTAQMPDGCGNLQANTGQCKQCHATGYEGFTASPVSAVMFQRVSTNRKYLQKYFMVTGIENPATAKLDLNLPLFESVLSGTGTHFEHPRVNNNGTPTNNDCTTAMKQFYDLTMAAAAAAGPAGCGPSKLLD